MKSAHPAIHRVRTDASNMNPQVAFAFNAEHAPGRMTSITRRKFIKVTAAAGGGLGLGVASRIHAAEKTKPLSILILGGTGFTGPFQVKYALERGHKVTVFNRGKTHPSELPREVEQLIGDRNGQLDALKNRSEEHTSELQSHSFI